ncbi:leucine zipper protein 2 isoform X2 [Hirundo rustica]|uniref:leucine zipper protein 2 isoform X2 n=1 Tax=Hirundo rustica TaxID=43150 RepID=UPI0026712C81|nr:leucine zipper protein 2 isoform X2 [Hirundo rustica]
MQKSSGSLPGILQVLHGCIFFSKKSWRDEGRGLQPLGFPGHRKGRVPGQSYQTLYFRGLCLMSKKIQAQLKELRYGKKDLIFKVLSLVPRGKRWVPAPPLLLTRTLWTVPRSPPSFFSRLSSALFIRLPLKARHALCSPPWDAVWRLRLFLTSRCPKRHAGLEAQQLTDLEQKLSVAKGKLENAALDKESQLKALKETVQLCLSSVLRNQPPTMNVISSKAAEKLTSSNTTGAKVPFQVTSTKVWKNVSAEKENFHVALRKEENQGTQECDSQDVAKTCLGNCNDSKPRLKAAEAETSFQELHSPPWTKPEDKKPPEKKEKKYKESVSTAGKNL